MAESQGQSLPVQGEYRLDRMPEKIQHAARTIFGERLPQAEKYVEHLATTGIEWGLLGPREIPKLWDRHVLNCAVVEEAIEQGSLVADVGSGAGLPGLCLALARPDAHFILIEPLERRVAWLDSVVEDLELHNVDVIRARSEQLSETLDVDVVTARAVSALKSLIPITIPLLSGNGKLVAIKGKSAQDEIDNAQKALRKHKCGKPRVQTVGAELLDEPTTVVVVPVGTGK